MSNESRRLLAETRALSGLLEDRRFTNDQVLRAALRKHKRALRAELRRRGHASEDLTELQHQAVMRHTPRSADTSRIIDATEAVPIPRID